MDKVASLVTVNICFTLSQVKILRFVNSEKDIFLGMLDWILHQLWSGVQVLGQLWVQLDQKLFKVGLLGSHLLLLSAELPVEELVVVVVPVP